MHHRLIARNNMSWIVDRRKHCRRAVVLAGLTLGLLAMLSSGSRGADRRSPVVEKRVEQVLRKHANSTGAAGIAFGMVQQDSTVLECYTGYASWGDKAKLDSSSVFNWASLSKSLTAVCALKMVEQGQLNLDADVKTYLPELDLHSPVTLRQLLDQQAGIGGYDEYPELLELKKLDRKALTQQAIIEKMSGKRPVFAPGTRQGYSSPGYILLSIAMERAAKKPFSEIVDEIVAKPLKLKSIRVGDTSDADVVPYQMVDGKRERIEDTNNDWRLGAGAVKSSLPDALAFASSLIKSSILTPESSKELFKRRAVVKHAEGFKGDSFAVTYGFLRVGEGSDSSIMASGEQPGARAFLIIYPRQQMASVIFANTTPLDLERIQLAAMEVLAEK